MVSPPDDFVLLLCGAGLCPKPIQNPSELTNPGMILTNAHGNKSMGMLVS
jgi:hypothetical protein